VKLRSIVVGTDLGESGRRALQLAIPTARAAGAKIWLTHANEVGLDHRHWPDLPLGAQSAVRALRRRLRGRYENSMQALEAQRQECERAEVDCQLLCEEGQAWATILQSAVSTDAELIIVGDPVGTGGMPQRLLGSTSERVVLHAPCSVLVVCGRVRQDYDGARIAVGVDFSENGLEAVRWARDVARVTHGQITLIHVVPHPRLPNVVRQEWTGLLEGVGTAARARMERLIAIEGLPADTKMEVLDGPVGKCLCDAAADMAADLLFVGTRGQDRLRGMLLGSTSQYCLRYSPVPVLTARS
jgi:nucleotide-binding universal stress UspA family protein